MAAAVYTPEYCSSESYLKQQSEFTRLADGAPTRTWEYVWAREQSPEGCTALEVGAWPSYFSLGLVGRYQAVIATDSFAWAKRPEIAGAEGIRSPALWSAYLWGKGVRAGCLGVDVQRLTLEPFARKLDAIFAVSMLEHVPDDGLALEEMLDSARPGGRVVVTTDISATGAEYADYGRVYSPRTLADLVERVTGERPEIAAWTLEAPWMHPEYTVCGVVLERL